MEKKLIIKKIIMNIIINIVNIRNIIVIIKILLKGKIFHSISK